MTKQRLYSIAYEGFNNASCTAYFVSSLRGLDIAFNHYSNGAAKVAPYEFLDNTRPAPLTKEVGNDRWRAWYIGSLDLTSNFGASFLCGGIVDMLRPVLTYAARQAGILPALREYDFNCWVQYNSRDKELSLATQVGNQACRRWVKQREHLNKPRPYFPLVFPLIVANLAKRLPIDLASTVAALPYHVIEQIEGAIKERDWRESSPLRHVAKVLAIAAQRVADDATPEVFNIRQPVERMLQLSIINLGSLFNGFDNFNYITPELRTLLTEYVTQCAKTILVARLHYSYFALIASNKQVNDKFGIDSDNVDFGHYITTAHKVYARKYKNEPKRTDNICKDFDRATAAWFFWQG